MANERKAQLLFKELLAGLSDSTKNAYNKQRDIYKNISLSRDNELYKNVCILSTVIINDMLSKGEDIERYMHEIEVELKGNKILIADDIDTLSPGLMELIKDESNIISRYLEVHNVELRLTNDFIDSAIELYAIYFKIDISDITAYRNEFIGIANKLGLKAEKIERCLISFIEHRDKKKMAVDKLNDTQARVFFNICISTAYMYKLASLSEELGGFFKKFIKVRYGDIPVYSVVKINVNAYANDNEFVDNNLIVKKENENNWVTDGFENKSKLTQHIQFQSQIVEEVV